MGRIQIYRMGRGGLGEVWEEEVKGLEGARGRGSSG